LASLWSPILPCARKYESQCNAVVEFECTEYEPIYVRTYGAIIVGSHLTHLAAFQLAACTYVSLFGAWFWNFQFSVSTCLHCLCSSVPEVTTPW